jgi:hypothetical protein
MNCGFQCINCEKNFCFLEKILWISDTKFSIFVYPTCLIVSQALAAYSVSYILFQLTLIKLQFFSPDLFTPK